MAPWAIARWTSLSWPRFDSTMTGMCRVVASSFNAFNTSKPWILGMMRSRRTRSGCSARARRVLAAERSEHLQPGQLRHQHVQQDQVGQLAPGEPKPFLTVGGGRDRQPALPQTRLAGAAQESVVLDEQHPFLGSLHRL